MALFKKPDSPDKADGTLTHRSQGEFEFQLQIGFNLFPEYPIRSPVKEDTWLQAFEVNNFDVCAVEYRDCKLVLGRDCEKVLDASFAGLNTRACDLMTACVQRQWLQ